MEKSGLLVGGFRGAELREIAQVESVGLLVSGACVHVVAHEQHNLVVGERERGEGEKWRVGVEGRERDNERVCGRGRGGGERNGR